MIISFDFACKDSIKFRFKEENGHKKSNYSVFLVTFAIANIKMKMNQRLTISII